MDETKETTKPNTNAPSEFANLSKLAGAYLAAQSAEQSAWDELGKFQLPRDVSSQADLAAREEIKGKMIARSNDLHAAAEKRRDLEAALLDAIPETDVVFRIKVGGAEHSIEKKYGLDGRLKLLVQ